MALFLFLVVLLAAHKAEICRKGYFSDYIGYQNIQPIKGIFLVMVFFRHFPDYVTLNGVWDPPFFEIDGWFRQLIVVPFLFYSGYGIAESIRRKGTTYVRQMPGQRILKVLFQFDVAVVLFVAMQFFLGKEYDLKRILLCFLCWESVGNSNWYIFAVLLLYAATWLSHLIFRKGKLAPLLSMTALTFLFIFIMQDLKGGWWYNTVLAYVTGMWFSNYRENFEKNVLANEKNYWLWLGVTAAAFLFVHRFIPKLAPYETASVLFALLLVLVTAKVRIQNQFLSYCGEHLFSLYILQRIPMIALNNTAVEANPYVYFLVCAGITFLLSAAFDKFTPWLWNVLFPRKNAPAKGNN